MAWKKRREERNDIIWTSGNGRVMRIVSYWKNQWIIDIDNPSLPTKTFKNKTKALIFAKRWMKARPNG